MTRRNCLGWGLTVLFAALAPAVADEDQRPEKERRGGRPEITRQRDRGMNPSKYMGLLEKLERDLMKAIEPDEEYAEEIKAVFEDYIEDVREQSASSREDRRDRAEEIRDLMREMREARADGDADRARELREELATLRKSDSETKYVHEDLFAELREMLAEPDVEELDKLANEFERRLSGPGRRGADRIGLMQRAVSTLQLSDEQSEIVREILDEAKHESAELDEDERNDLAESVREAITDELDDEQRDIFLKRYQQLVERGERRPESMSGGRRGRPARDQAAPSKPAPEAKAPDAAGQADELAEEVADEGMPDEGE